MSKRSSCPVCQGQGTIKLPLRMPATVSYKVNAPISMEPVTTSKTFACPECGPTVAEDRVAVLEFHAEVPDVERAAEDVRRHAAYAFVDQILARGYITFTKGPKHEYRPSYALYGTVGVVAPAAVASMEERIAERQALVATEVARAAEDKIALWGSYFTGRYGNISKDQAIDSVKEALKEVLAQRNGAAA